ncbi:MAG: hypothetical protein RR651_11495 [Lysinibacillus sp.]
MDIRVEEIFIEEIQKQCNYGLLCSDKMKEILSNLSRENSHEFWFYVQGFLISAANVSKLLWGADKPSDNKKRFKERKPLREKLNISEYSILNKRTIRNCYEHFDEKVESWVVKSKNKNFVNGNIGPSNMLGSIKKSDIFRFYDNEKHIISFHNSDLPVALVIDEMKKLNETIFSL